MVRRLHLQGCACGHGGGAWSHYQRLFIIPSLKAVIVRQGSGGNFSDAQFLRLVLGRME
jgi:hypothetical protein